RANPRPANEPGSDLPPQGDEYVSAGGMGHFPQQAQPLRIASDKPIPELFPHQDLRLKIEALASTYDASNIPALAGYLDHADPMVRDSARLGLIQLSRPEAASVLRAAAKRTTDADEAAALIEAAEFLASISASS
nr:HEAT repeat domain-containing protein [Opitutaceae bacterium]